MMMTAGGVDTHGSHGENRTLVLCFFLIPPTPTEAPRIDMKKVAANRIENKEGKKRSSWKLGFLQRKALETMNVKSKLRKLGRLVASCSCLKLCFLVFIVFFSVGKYIPMIENSTD